MGNELSAVKGDFVPRKEIDSVIFEAEATGHLDAFVYMTISFHSMSLPTARLVWHCPYISLFHSKDGRGAGSFTKDRTFRKWGYTNQEEFLKQMKCRKTWQIVLFIAICVCMNLVGKLLSINFGLPLWADSFGTVLCSYIAGPVCGAMVGVTGNLFFSVINRLSALYSITSIALSIIVGIGGRRKWFDRFYGFMVAATISMFTALIVSVPVNILFSNGYTGNKWGDGVIGYLADKEWPFFICSIIGQLAIEFVDKVLTIAMVYVLILIRRMRVNQGSAETNSQGSAVLPIMLLSLSLCLALSSYVWAEPLQQAEPVDYNDYVQSVYSSSNGLPCGEANDIAQTNDGVLWIGTYAGLYRYNGREFRWVDNYESVKNVNCLYVDEEGRLWIGTNDNGLSIVIREKVVNILDQSSGLPSNSVRCIVHSSDGYYYVGTAGSLQVIEMNNGLKTADTLEEVYYADSITADEEGHVAAVASDGKLFLLEKGKTLCSLQLPNENEIFNCCEFAPDGTLMAGSSANHIYSYDVSGHNFKELKVITCEDVRSINNLSYLSDGTLFISTDSGVSYIDKSGYHRLNTNDFNNSIDKMLCDYQGNLWFTSSRLGLLRLAKSPFKDVYGSIGMDRKVVNSIVAWQDGYYIGTDKGLDIVDRSCRRQIDNDMTKDLHDKRIRCMYVDKK